MLNKLIKHEHNNISKFIFPAYGLALVLVIVAYGIHLLGKLINQNIFNYIAIPLIDGLSVVYFVGLAIVTPLFMAVLFYKTMVSNEGYLTHTLPVKKSELVISKNLVATIYSIASFIVCVAMLILFLFLCHGQFLTELLPTKEILNDFFTFVSNYYSKHAVTLTLTIVLFILAWILQTYSNLGLYYTSVALGQMMNKHKIVWSVVFFFAINIGLNTFVLTFMSIITMLLPISSSSYDAADIFTEKNSALFILAYVSIAFLLNAAFSFVYNLVCIKLMEKKLNLE